MASTLAEVFADTPFVTPVPNFYADDVPQITIPTDLLITSYCPDIDINPQSPSISPLELICPLDFAQHI